MCEYSVLFDPLSPNMRQKFDLDRDHLHTCLAYEFRLGGKAAAAHRRLCQAFGGGVIGEKTCFDRLTRFKYGNYRVEDKAKSGHHLRVGG